MRTRGELDKELDHLADMLPPWLEHLRHSEQFWPQFEMLAEEIIGHCGDRDRFHVERRLVQMLRRHRLDRKYANRRRHAWRR